MSSKVCAIHQPQFLPWLGYLDKIRAADVFIFLDDVQYKKNEFQNRNRIRAGNEPRWLTVPVRFNFGDTLRQTQIADATPWRRKIIGTLEQYYGRTPYFAEFAPGLFAILEQPWANLAELNEATVRWLLGCFGITTPLLVSSAMAPCASHPTGRLIELCRQVGAGTYLSGAGGHDYLEADRFAAAGLELRFQHYAHPVYPQHNAGGGELMSHLSAVDLLFNRGPAVQLKD